MEKELFIFSAQSKERLDEYMTEFSLYLKKITIEDVNPHIFKSIAYTLQVGREEMPIRLAIVAENIEALLEKIGAYLQKLDIDGIYKSNNVKMLKGSHSQQTLREEDWNEIALQWIKGIRIDWDNLYKLNRPKRISLPGYSFAREAYWVEEIQEKMNIDTIDNGRIFTIINESDIKGFRYRICFTGNEEYLEDHKVNKVKVLPAVVFIDIILEVLYKLLNKNAIEPLNIRIDDIIWLAPYSVENKIDTLHAVLSIDKPDKISFKFQNKISKTDNAVVFCRGKVSWDIGTNKKVDPGLIGKDLDSAAIIEGKELYQKFIGLGVEYGPSHQGVQSIYLDNHKMKVILKANHSFKKYTNNNMIPPGLLDSSIHAIMGFANTGVNGIDIKEIQLPFSAKCIEIAGVITEEMQAYISRESSSNDNLMKYNIELYDLNGNLCIRIKELMLKSVNMAINKRNLGSNNLYFKSEWLEKEINLKNMPVNLSKWIAVLIDADEHIVNAVRRDMINTEIISLNSNNLSQAEKYKEYASILFRKIKESKLIKSGGKLLMQVFIPDNQKNILFSGLGSMLRTAHNENFNFLYQVIENSQKTVTSEEVIQRLNENRCSAVDQSIFYLDKRRMIQTIKNVQISNSLIKEYLKNHGTYLITGGNGGLGLIVAKSIVSRVENPTLILTGRSPLTEEKQRYFDEILNTKANVHYCCCDVCDLDAVRDMVEYITKTYGDINGIFHCAGMTKDTLIVKKNEAEFMQVLAPKITGTANLDIATKNQMLDFFVLFSSLASIIGNIGQADYAAANAFMDKFAVYRNYLTGRNERKGFAVSLNWPLWKNGGMNVVQSDIAKAQEKAGLIPLDDITGIEMMDVALNNKFDQIILIKGIEEKVKPYLQNQIKNHIEFAHKNKYNLTSNRFRSLIKDVKNIISGETMIPIEKINEDTPFGDYGIDSVMIIRIVDGMEKKFGDLPKTLLFEFETVNEVSKYLLNNCINEVKDIGEPEEIETTVNSGMIENKNVTNIKPKEIAVIGIAGIYPDAPELNIFWENLASGRDCVHEIPKNRWNHELVFDPEKGKPGKSYCKWGGFLDDIDKFDPLFFNISPVEAEFIDPQERMFMETCWHAMEDAGYAGKTTKDMSVGVFAGVMNGLYQLLETNQYGGRLTGESSYASIANRVSYFMDLSGPSISVDTMCSSSLTTVHLACNSILLGESDMAIAGGVNLITHPDKYVQFSQNNFFSTDGKCRSFGEGGDGYVPGEGVGAVVIKALAQAVKDGDQIYGVIKGTAINSGGRTSGYTVPSLKAQTELIRKLLNKTGIDPATISYVEAHGTGTALGDPIEISAISNAYKGYTNAKQFCSIGSVKSNIGHLESAAGIAALTKVLLQMKYKKLVPSLHSEYLNPYINFKDTPFKVQQKLEDWKAPVVDGVNISMRRAAISSFGAGGSNAHIIVEEFCRNDMAEELEVSKEKLFVFSALNQEKLKELINQILSYLNRITKVSAVLFEEYHHLVISTIAEILKIEDIQQFAAEDIIMDFCLDNYQLNQLIDLIFEKTKILTPISKIDNELTIEGLTNFLVKITNQKVNNDISIDLEAIAYTLQLGRKEMDTRLAISASTIEELIDGLNSYLKDKFEDSKVFIGMDNEIKDKMIDLFNSKSIKKYIDETLQAGDLKSIAKMWVWGASVDWSILYSGKNVRKISLPGYPFSKEKCWITPDRPEHRLVPDSKNSLMGYLKEVFSKTLKIPMEQLDENTDFQTYGIDSIRISQLLRNMEDVLGKLPVSVLFSCRNLKSLNHYLLKNNIEFADNINQNKNSDILKVEEVAIIGVNGIFPKANNLTQFHKNLLNGVDCITEIPAERWDYRDYPNIKCKWGGFIDDADKFDPQFFNIAPMNAKVMDPQERLFVQAVWSCIEDAGYTPEQLIKTSKGNKKGNVAVFAGVTFNEYGLHGANELEKGKQVPINSQIFSVANRISYLLNLHGPSMSVDTACSSSLMALHLACQSIIHHEAEAAIAGGVNLTIHPSKYITLNMSNFLAEDGHCRSFGQGGTGYVPGEGVGAVLLKPLSKAIEDKDNIYGVIKGSAVNHGGKAHGYTVPNPKAQSDVIKEALLKADISPRTISYVEAHGTGTALGDPIEIEALNDAYKKNTSDNQYCSIGSVKSCIGHLEGASGISQVIKVLMQFKYHKLYQSRLNSSEINHNIDFSKTPFYLQTETEDWVNPVIKGKPYPRRAGISSFGVGGVNVHMILEEYDQVGTNNDPELKERMIIPVSANDIDSLKAYVKSLSDYVKEFVLANKHDNLRIPTLREFSYTLQNGRIVLPCKVVFAALSYNELVLEFDNYLKGSSNGNCEETGTAADINKAFGENQPYKVSLPTYPFKKERYWLSVPGKIDDLNINASGKYSVDKLQNIPPSERAAYLVRFIQKLIADLLGFKEGTLPDCKVGFFELGMESVTTTQAFNLLEATFNKELDMQLFFNYPNIEKLSDYILSLIDFDEEDNYEELNVTKDSELLYLKPVWIPDDNLIKNDKIKTLRTVIYFSRDAVDFDLDKIQMDLGIDLILICDGMKFEALAENKYSMNFTIKNDYLKLLNILTDQGKTIEKIIYQSSKKQMNLSSEDDVIPDLEDLYLLCQSFIQLKLMTKIQIIYSFIGVTQKDSLLKVPISSYGKSLNAENPLFMIKTVKLTDSGLSLTEQLALLEKELVCDDFTPEVKISGGKRFVRRLLELKINNTSFTTSTFKENGVYIITGGLGNLAILFAKYICSQIVANIILVGRREISNMDLQTINEMEMPGGTVTYIQADISCKKSVNNLVNSVKERYGVINGIIHAAGLIKDSYIQKKSISDVYRVIKPKIKGTLILDEFLKDEHLDFFMLFSSLASVVGNAGQSDYCYANGFLDNFSFYRKSLSEKGERYGHTITVNWPFWRNGGMKINSDTSSLMERKIGIHLLENEEGIQAFKTILELKEPQLVVTYGDKEKIKKMFNILDSPEGDEGIFEDEEAEKDLETLNSIELAGELEKEIDEINCLLDGGSEDYGR